MIQTEPTLRNKIATTLVAGSMLLSSCNVSSPYNVDNMPYGDDKKVSYQGYRQTFLLNVEAKLVVEGNSSGIKYFLNKGLESGSSVDFLLTTHYIIKRKGKRKIIYKSTIDWETLDSEFTEEEEAQLESCIDSIGELILDYKRAEGSGFDRTMKGLRGK